jgi:hypothetical protein
VQTVASAPYCSGGIPVFDFTQCTIGSANNIIESGDHNIYFANSILANVTNLIGSGSQNFYGTANGFFSSPVFGDSQVVTYVNPFQPNIVGAGAYYLANNSPFQNAGQSSIDATALSSIRQKTTIPPLVLSGISDTDVTLGPRARKDLDTPDLGYHYSPIDYIADCYEVTNATLTITNGTTIANYWGTGIWLADGAAIVCEGKPNSPNRFIDYLTVQEQPIIIGSSASLPLNSYRYSGVGSPATFRFTEFRHLKGGAWISGMYSFYIDGGHWAFSDLTVRDCLFSGGAISSTYAPSGGFVKFKNNLFLEDSLDLTSEGQTVFNNNLLKNSSASFLQEGSGTFSIQNNAFDASYVMDYTGTTTHDHNAYIATPSTDFPTQTGDVVLSSYVYTSGPLGNYYQATNQTTTLIDRGNFLASLAGLSHYTTITNLQNGAQIKEGNTQVDIGFHFVATDANGIPTDTDGDGLPDYLEDRNGNGNAAGQQDSGETDWNTYDSPNGLSTSSRLSVLTPLKAAQ